MNRAVVILVVLLCVALAAPIVAAVAHLIAPGTSTQQPVSPAEMNERMEMAALRFQVYAPVPRVAFIDFAYPADAGEYHRMGGYGVLLMVAFSHERRELPPKRLYAMVDGKEIELDLLTSASSRQDPNTAIGIVFGANRWEGLYAFPVELGRTARELRIDYAANRDGFTVYKFEDDGRAELASLPAGVPQSSRPSPAALTGFVEREYPGFLRK